MIKNTFSNRSLCSEIEKTLADSRYTFRFQIDPEDGYIRTQLTVRPGAPEFTPTVYIDFDQFWREECTVEVSVQTTSYGPLTFEDAIKVADGLREAAELAKKVAFRAQLAGFRVTGSAF